MAETDNRYGKYNEDGTVTEPGVSILTGQPITKEGSVRERIPGTPYFYRFEGRFADRVTDEIRQGWRSSAPAATRTTSPLASRKVEQPPEG